MKRKIEEKWDVETLSDSCSTSAENNSSTVLLINAGEKRLALTGDTGRRLWRRPSTTCALTASTAARSSSFRCRTTAVITVGPTILNYMLGPKLPAGSPMPRTAFVSSAKSALKHRRRVTNAYRRRGVAVHATEGMGKSPLERPSRCGRAGGPLPLPFYNEAEEEVKWGTWASAWTECDRRARLMPALLVILPAALAVVALAPDAVLGWGGGIALIVQAGGSFLLAQFVGTSASGRSRSYLRPSADVRPSACSPISTRRTKVILADRHRGWANCFRNQDSHRSRGAAGPPEGALEIYTACCDKLRGLVRAQKEKFADVHRENIHYGFRRNLWALKPAGIAVTLVALVQRGARNLRQRQRAPVDQSDAAGCCCHRRTFCCSPGYS